MSGFFFFVETDKIYAERESPYLLMLKSLWQPFSPYHDSSQTLTFPLKVSLRLSFEPKGNIHKTVTAPCLDSSVPLNEYSV